MKNFASKFEVWYSPYANVWSVWCGPISSFFLSFDWVDLSSLMCYLLVLIWFLRDSGTQCVTIVWLTSNEHWSLIIILPAWRGTQLKDSPTLKRNAYFIKFLSFNDWALRPLGRTPKGQFTRVNKWNFLFLLLGIFYGLHLSFRSVKLQKWRMKLPGWQAVVSVWCQIDVTRIVCFIFSYFIPFSSTGGNMFYVCECL